ncbi:hypothetical protein RND81_13G071000 [Saponaria officinalis]|uniref:Transcription elongation factor Eaf N-terminal domain-containing protein n=1 Tax=Saponaria officinalis TaxID=3572 RepID=A0AAW1GY16_SAPOF
MMSKREGLNAAPIPDQWYTLTLGSSFNDLHPQPSPKVCTLRYDFVPASVDKTQPGALHRRKDKINVELNHVQPGKPKFNFEGTGDDSKENDAVMYFDGNSFRLERLHRAVKRLKHCRLPGEHAAAAVVDPSSSPLGRVPAKGHSPAVNNRVATLTPPPPQQPLPPPPPPPPVSVEVERINIGDVEQIDIGEVERIDTGGDEQIDIGDAEHIDIGGDEQIDIGDVERIDIGNVERIDIGDVERIDVSDARMSGGKSRNSKFATNSPPPSEYNATISPDSKDFDLEAHLDIMNDDDDDDDASGPDKGGAEENTFTGIDINLPHQNDSDDEIADVDVNDDNGVMGGNAAAALRAQVHKQENDDQTSSSSASSGSDSSDSSESGSASSSSDSDTSEALSV